MYGNCYTWRIRVENLSLALLDRTRRRTRLATVIAERSHGRERALSERGLLAAPTRATRPHQAIQLSLLECPPERSHGRKRALYDQCGPNFSLALLDRTRRRTRLATVIAERSHGRERALSERGLLSRQRA